MWRWQWLAELAKEHEWKVGAELGVMKGILTEYLSAQGVAMLAVDLWAPQLDNDSQTYADWEHEKYLADLRDITKGRDVTLLRMSTTEASKVVRDESLDFVFIDADHSYEGVKEDIKNWTPKVRKGGAITGHDYDWEGAPELEGYTHWPGVKKAVDEAFDNVIEGPNKCWLVWK